MPFVQQRRPSLWIEIAVLVAILAVAAVLRLVQLDAVPPGMTHDEAAFGAEAERVLSGERPIYFALGYGHEPLYAYLVALAFSLLGHSLTAMRVTSAVCGLLVVLGTYLLARRMYGVQTGWIAAAWMAVAFWSVSLSRQALRAITLPMVWLPAAWFFWRGFGPALAGTEPGHRSARMADFTAAGVLLGATVYTYMASRVAWLVYPLFVAYLALRRETRVALARIWPGLVVMTLVAVLVAAPLALYLRANPTSELRVEAMMEPLRELLAGEPGRVARHAWNAVRVFSWEGDRFWGYNLPGRPVFDWLGSTLFYVGLGIALWRWRDPPNGFLLIWLAVGMAPAMVTTNEGIFLRAIVAQPVTYLFVVRGMWAGGRAVLRWAGSRNRWAYVAFSVAAVAVVAAEGVRTYRAYFVDWPSRPEARNIYNHTLVAAARYLRDVPAGGAVGISALYPLYYHDPWIVRYVTRRPDLQIRWFGGQVPYPAAGIVYPSEGEGRYVFTALTLLDPALRSEFAARARLIERHELAPNDQNPFFEVWGWQGGSSWFSTLEGIQSEMWISPEVRFDQPELRLRLDEGAQFGDVMILIGYRVNGDALAAGDVVELVTYWRALRTVKEEDDWVTFVHLLDANSQVLGGVDLLHCPPTGWMPGDVAVQVHRFAVERPVPPGEGWIEVGVYRRSTGRLPVTVEAAAGDRVLLSPARVE
jgi:4-amino-4-deoxy-L-arabinose transferase-like glycosyltransferase